MSNRPFFAGVDVGGTNIKVGLVGDDGEIIAYTHFPTEQEKGPQYALENTAETIRQLIGDSGLESVDLLAAGIATPGPLDIPSGMILTPFNMGGWRNFNVRDTFSALVDRPVEFANDAGAAAYGEFWIGSGKHHASMVLLTLGTGVGGGIVLDDYSVFGEHSHGAEIGHMTIDISENARICPCGKPGHLEAYSSATAVVSRCIELLESGEPSCLRDQFPDLRAITALDIANAAEASDPLANRIIDEAATFLGKGIGSLAQIIDPAVVLLGGAMDFGGSGSDLGRRFAETARAVAADCSLPVVAKNLKVQFASLGSDAGFVGAAGLARVAWNSRQNAGV